MINYL